MAWEFFAVICQKGYLMMTGVLYPTPSSRKRMLCPLLVRRKFSYRSAALCQPSENSGLHWFGIFEVFTLQEYIDLTLFSIADYIDAVDNDL